MSKNLLVALADKNCIDQAKQLFSSVYFNAGWKGDYMLMSYNIPEKELTWFKNKGILIYKCKPIHNGKESGIEYLPLEDTIPENKKIVINRMRGQQVMLSKFEMFTPYFKKWDTVLYLDCDIIVRYSLDKLTKVKGFCAVRDDPSFPSIKDQFIKNGINDLVYKKLEKEFNLRAKAFNAGVVAFNTDIIKNDTFDKLLELFQKYYTICSYGDQPILNLYFYKKWKKINFMYNLWVPMWKYYFVFKAPENIDAIVIHTLGPEKAWLPKSPFYKEWRNNLLKADQIDLKNRAIYARVFNKTTENAFNYNYFIRIIVIKIRLTHFYLIIDKNIGRTGIFLKKNYPKIYKFLKKKRQHNVN